MWHLIAYDISDPKRLYRVHKNLISQAFALQKSVFLLPGKTSKLTKVLDELNQIIHAGEDDIRAYPIQHPDQLWMLGSQLPDNLKLGHNKETPNLLTRIKGLFHAG